MKRQINIGTRGSRLAIRQAETVGEQIKKIYPHIIIEIVTIKTKGDKILDRTLDKIGGKGVFVKEIEQALFDKRIDIAVHSLKDMPDELPEGLSIGAVLKRENPMDVLIAKEKISWETLPPGAKIGTGSLRRKTQLLELRPDLEVLPIRGNIETRMNYLNKGFDAVVLAAAGLIRCGFEDRISDYFTLEEMIPASCQGILAVQSRDNDREVNEILEQLKDTCADTSQRAERAFLKEIGADCHAPAGALAFEKEGTLFMRAMFYQDKMYITSGQAQLQQAEELGQNLAKDILKQIKEADR